MLYLVLQPMLEREINFLLSDMLMIFLEFIRTCNNILKHIFEAGKICRVSVLQYQSHASNSFMTQLFINVR